jgi:hypothetical protein
MSTVFNIIESKCKTNENCGKYLISMTDPETKKRKQYSATYSMLPSKTRRSHQTKEEAYEIILQVQQKLKEKYKDVPLF